MLVSGALQVTKGPVVVNTVARPGALVGEIALLLDAINGATVRATEPSVLRHAVDGRALLASDPAITRLVAIGLAERLNFAATYLADLKLQYGDAPGLSMVADALARLAERQAPVRPARRATRIPSTSDGSGRNRPAALRTRCAPAPAPPRGAGFRCP